MSPTPTPWFRPALVAICRCASSTGSLTREPSAQGTRVAGPGKFAMARGGSARLAGPGGVVSPPPSSKASGERRTGITWAFPGLSKREDDGSAGVAAGCWGLG
jgi:hypothetical protein